MWLQYKYEEISRSNKVDYKDINVSKEGNQQVIKNLHLEGFTFPMVFLNKKYIGGYEDSIENKDLLNKIKEMQEKKTDKEESQTIAKSKLYIN